MLSLEKPFSYFLKVSHQCVYLYRHLKLKITPTFFFSGVQRMNRKKKKIETE